MIKRFLIVLIIANFGCEKATCWNGFGDLTKDEIILGQSFDSIVVGTNIEVELFQDSGNYIRLITGDKILPNITTKASSHKLEIRNNNRCDFLINNAHKTLVELHFSTYQYLKFETEKNILFKDTVKTNRLDIFYEFGGGELNALVEVNHLRLVAYNSTANFNLKGKANSSADIRVQMRAWGDAREFISPNYFIYNNSAGDLLVNLDDAEATIRMTGTGNVRYQGIPDSLIILPENSAGKCIPE